MNWYPILVLLTGVAVVIAMIMVFRINAFFALITAAIAVSVMSPGDDRVSRVADAFGKSAGGIGIVIALAAVIGKCLMDSGAADRIVRSLLGLFGEKRVPFALMGSGFVLSVPVFFDTVFYLLIPLARSMWQSKRTSYLLYIMAIVAGGAVTHSMVPPTPGPLAMADNLGIDLGVMILVGTVVGLPMSMVGLAVCWMVDRSQKIVMRPYPGELKTPQVAEQDLPPLWVSLLPVLLPVVLIGANTIASATIDPTNGNARAMLRIVRNLGNPNIALLFSAAISIFLVVRYRNVSLASMSQTLEKALMSGGMVILITAAGGAFGKMLAAAGMQDSIQTLLGETDSVGGVTVLVSAFAVASFMKFAQGSGTVSMITTSSIFAAMGFSAEQLGFHMVYVATAIGSGSLVGDWMNNSGFWIFSKMSVLTTPETLKTWTVLTAALGLTGLFVTMLAASIFPMVE